MNAPAEASPGVVKACCADLWAHPGIRMLAGDALRPGGLELTARALDAAPLRTGARVLDVGCGPGATLRELRRRGVTSIGVDYSSALAAEASTRAPAAAADAERLPLRDGSFDAAVMECVLSAVPSKQAALAEVARVLVPGGALLLSDVTREGPLPPALDTLAGWIACAAGGLGLHGYARLLEGAGFRVERAEDQREALVVLVAQARRRVALLEGALASGLLGRDAQGLDPALVALGGSLLQQAADAAADGVLGYALILARRA